MEYLRFLERKIQFSLEKNKTKIQKTLKIMPNFILEEKTVKKYILENLLFMTVKKIEFILCTQTKHAYVI